MKPSVRIVIFAVASLWPVATSAQQLSTRVGSLSPQRAFAESAEGKAGSSVLSADARAADAHFSPGCVRRWSKWQRRSSCNWSSIWTPTP
jgi:hypothetical protein